MTQKNLLELKETLLGDPSSDARQLRQEAIEYLIAGFDRMTMDDIMFILDCTLYTPSIVYDKVTNTYICMEVTNSNVITYDDELVTVYSFYTYDDGGWKLTQRDAVKVYAQKIYAQ